MTKISLSSRCRYLCHLEVISYIFVVQVSHIFVVQICIPGSSRCRTSLSSRYAYLCHPGVDIFVDQRCRTSLTIQVSHTLGRQRYASSWVVYVIQVTKHIFVIQVTIYDTWTTKISLSSRCRYLCHPGDKDIFVTR